MKMMILLLLYLVVCQAQPQATTRGTLPSSRKLISGSRDEHGACYCSVVLSDRTFPKDHMEFLEISNHNLSLSLQQELTKIQHHQIELGLKLKLKILFEKLKSSISRINEIVEELYEKIPNISIMATQLEGNNQNNVLATRKKILVLQKHLNEYKSSQKIVTPSQVKYGTCDHGIVVNVSKPLVVQLNWLGSSNKYGAWGRDSLLGADQNVQWVSPLSTSARQMNILRLYSSYNNLLINSHTLDRSLPSSAYGQGGGMIMFNNTMYYNIYNTRDLCKYNPQTNEIERRTLPDASYNNQLSYVSSDWQDIDLAADEHGLWVIYATEASLGKTVISKLDPISLSVIKTWQTSQYKRGATNAFMVCGVLYVTRARNVKQEEIFYMYDTKTGKEGNLSIMFDKMKENVQSIMYDKMRENVQSIMYDKMKENVQSIMYDKMRENVQSLSYNPNDHKLYMYNKGYLITYDINFIPRLGNTP